MNVDEHKKILRKWVRQKLQPVSEEVVCQTYSNWELFLNAKVIHCFMNLPHEMSLTPLIEQCHVLGKTVVIPKFSRQTTEIKLAVLGKEDQTTIGAFGVRQPATHAKVIHKQEVDLWFVPGLAFSLTGARLGYGKGYYDRLLFEVEQPLVGACLEKQIIDYVPADHFDVSVHHLITENSLIHI